MHPFSYVESSTPEAAIQAVVTDPEAQFFAGGTTLIDLMKLDVMTPDTLVDINRLPFSSVEAGSDGITIGANVKNSDLAHHRLIREHAPVLSEAVLAGASAQLRNMATTAGNIMQRTRCNYFRDVHSKCNKRSPGSGCDAMDGFNRGHAILGTSDDCIATNPSDMCVAMVMLDAQIRTRKADGSGRMIRFEDFHLLPGDTPHRETILAHGELITHIHLPNVPMARRSHYFKVRDRASYEFALTSSAVALEIDNETIVAARVGLGGIATKPWRSHEAEAVLQGRSATRETFESAANAALAGARPRLHNKFKVELAKHTMVAALEELLRRKYNPHQ
jgi:xanthine dehydrogenase YagS FAD-binding subunit